jgi:hypothetical protein
MKRLILILLALASPLAFGESDGNYLLGACGAAVHLADGYHGSATDEIKAAYCVGVVHAVVFFQKETVIFPEDGYGNPDPKQLIRVVDKYLHDHPEELAKPDTYLVIVALGKAFPPKRAK